MPIPTSLIVLSALTLGCILVVSWLFVQARRGGVDKATREALKDDLDRTQETLRVLSGPLPDPVDALDQLSDPGVRRNGSMPDDDRSRAFSIRTGMRL